MRHFQKNTFPINHMSMAHSFETHPAANNKHWADPIRSNIYYLFSSIIFCFRILRLGVHESVTFEWLVLFVLYWLTGFCASINIIYTFFPCTCVGTVFGAHENTHNRDRKFSSKEKLLPKIHSSIACICSRTANDCLHTVRFLMI